MNDRVAAAAKIINSSGAWCGGCDWAPDDPYTSPCEDCLEVVSTYARALDEAGLLAPDDDLKAARGALTDWWLNLDHKDDSRAPFVRSMIDMIDEHLEAADHDEEEEQQ